MKRALILAAAAAMSLPSPVLAQQPGPPRAAPRGDAATAVRMDAPTFVRMAMSSNALEIQASRLALQNAQGDDVKAFAQMMIDDHGNAMRRIQEVVAATGGPAATSAAPGGEAQMEPMHRQMLQQLSGQTGAQFDRAYIDLQRRAHQDAVQLFTTYSQGGDDPALRRLAVELLPVLQKHGEAAAALGRS